MIVQENGLEETPRFYTSLSDNPIRSVIEGGNSYNNLLRLKQILKLDCSLVGASTGGGGAIVPTIQEFEFNHDVTGAKPFIFIADTDFYAGDVIPVLLSLLKVYENTFKVTITNNYVYSGNINFTFRVEVYEIVSKGGTD